jgi:hypothetical protein
MAPLDPQYVGIYNDRKKSEIDVYVDNEWNGDRSWLYKQNNDAQDRHRIQRHSFRKVIISIKSRLK